MLVGVKLNITIIIKERGINMYHNFKIKLIQDGKPVSISFLLSEYLSSKIDYVDEGEYKLSIHTKDRFFFIIHNSFDYLHQLQIDLIDGVTEYHNNKLGVIEARVLNIEVRD